MNFIGTRGGEVTSAPRAILDGMAEGGGLYVPESLPKLSREEFDALLGMDYCERAAYILGKFFDEYPRDKLSKAIKEAYSKFDGEDPVPLVKIEDGLYILELFHGPTCAQTDFGVYLLPYLLEESMHLAGEKGDVCLITATSGDKGKSIMEAFRDRKGFRAVTFYPEESVSKMQKLQLVTQDGEGICSVAVRGSFDECQTAVKKILRRGELNEKLKESGSLLTTAGSINVGVLLARIAAFISGYLDLLGSEQISFGDIVDISLPAGNLGGVVCAYYAKKMGLPIGKIIVGLNRNNGLLELGEKGSFERKKGAIKTMSPGLDILMPLNLERLLFELSGRDSEITLERMKTLNSAGKLSLHAEEMKALRDTFRFFSASEEETVECIFEFFEEFTYPLDTHTAVAMSAARKYCRTIEEGETVRPVIVASSDSPYKLPQAVYYALTGNDVKDSFKGLKRIHLLTAMEVPNSLKALRYKPARFKGVVPVDKIQEEAEDFLIGEN